MARSRPDDSCTPACFQTGSVWSKPDTVGQNQVGSRPGPFGQNLTESDKTKSVPGWIRLAKTFHSQTEAMRFQTGSVWPKLYTGRQDQVRSRPEPFGRNLTLSDRTNSVPDRIRLAETLHSQTRPSSFQTGTVRPKPNTVRQNQFGSRPDPFGPQPYTVRQNQFCSRPDPFGQNLTQSDRTKSVPDCMRLTKTLRSQTEPIRFETGSVWAKPDAVREKQV